MWERVTSEVNLRVGLCVLRSIQMGPLPERLEGAAQTVPLNTVPLNTVPLKVPLKGAA
jgi:hypothetical protein